MRTVALFTLPSDTFLPGSVDSYFSRLIRAVSGVDGAIAGVHKNIQGVSAQISFKPMWFFLTWLCNTSTSFRGHPLCIPFGTFHFFWPYSMPNSLPLLSLCRRNCPIQRIFNVVWRSETFFIEIARVHRIYFDILAKGSHFIMLLMNVLQTKNSGEKKTTPHFRINKSKSDRSLVWPRQILRLNDQYKSRYTICIHDSIESLDASVNMVNKYGRRRNGTKSKYTFA